VALAAGALVLATLRAARPATAAEATTDTADDADEPVEPFALDPALALADADETP
jgi:hypothetical protein